MKNIYKIVLLLILASYKTLAQSTETYTTQETEANVSTSNNTTTLNLFNIDFDGRQIPISITYTHSGIKVKEKAGSLGYVWRLNNIGYINRIVNDKNDSNSALGWFSAANPSFSNVTTSDACSATCPQTFSYLGPDLSPDFFSVNTIDGKNFDFVFKKNSSGSPIPVILSNQDGYKINTNFNNLINGGVSFNIIDKAGVNYDFINGPNLQDANRSGLQESRNNYYLQTIKNLNNTDAVNIEYNTVAAEKKVYYRVGFNYYSGPSDNDWNSDIVQHFAEDYYFVDESRLDLKKIISKNSIVEFTYLNNDFDEPELDEINIKDINGNYVTGYKFEYDYFRDTDARTLIKISKYNTAKTNADPIYQFNYYAGRHFFNEIGHNEDYFGYNNWAYKTNLLPFAVRDHNNIVQPAGNYEPNLGSAKEHTLYQIINKYGGITEFEYRLKTEISSDYGGLYGGGLMIDTKKEISNVGPTKVTLYYYNQMSGFVIRTDSPEWNFCATLYPKKFYSNIPILVEVNGRVQENNLYHIQTQGNFFCLTSEMTFDENDMTKLLSITFRNYIPNYEGIFRTPLLKKETIVDNNIGGLQKTTEFQYSYQNVETINIAKIYTQRRSFSGGVTWYTIKSAETIPVNRIKVVERKETTMLNYQSLENTTTFTYVSNDSNILRSISQTESTGANLEKRYFYSNDADVAGEPYISNLITKNFIGVPILEQTYKGSEKLSEQKAVYAQDATTSNLLLPKYLYTKKGTDLVANLEKKVTYNLYDDVGNLLQYTTENNTPVSTIWGYNRTCPIAKLQNVLYSNISPLTISDLQSKSDADNDNCYSSTCKEEILRLALNNLRGSFPTSFINSFTYNPIVGLTSKIDPKGDKIVLEYDDYNRLKFVRDRNNNIITENNYHFLTQH